MGNRVSRRRALGLIAAAGRAPAFQKPRRPNILLILTDDHGIEYAGCYGNRAVRTPNVDRLAAESQRATAMFTGTAMCAPSRSMAFTGLYPHRNGAHPNHSQIRPGIRTLPHYLKPAGYRTVLAGKKHIGPEESFPFEYLPLEGVDAFLSNPGEQPFFLAVCTNDPHAPFRKQPLGKPFDPASLPVPPYLVDTPETRAELALYYNSVEWMDRQVGRTLDTLRRHGLEENTVTLYTGDNGAQFPFSKWTLYDAGLRMPFLVRWPGHVKAGSTTDALASFVDLLPSFVEIAGAGAPAGLDGRSLVPLWEGRRAEHHDMVFGAHTNLGIIDGSDYPVRMARTRTHKYIRNLKPVNRFENLITKNRDGVKAESGSYWPGWKARAAAHDAFAADRARLYQERPAEEFYDLRADPHELRNLAGFSAHAPALAALRRDLRQWMERQTDPLLAEWPAT